MMTISLNLKANASHVCLLLGKRKLAQSGVQQWQQHLVWWYLGAARGSKQPGNGTMAIRGAPSVPNGIFVGSMVGVTKKSKPMGFARPTVEESDVSMQVGVTKESKAMGFVRLTVEDSDVGMQVGVTKQSIAMGFVWLTVAESDVSMQVGVKRVPKGQLLIAKLTAGASVVSMQVVATSMS
jgi:hypothetical protein